MWFQEWKEANEDGSLLETLYKALDEVLNHKNYKTTPLHLQTSMLTLNSKFQVINLSECEVYSYDPNSDADPFIEKGAL